MTIYSGHAPGHLRATFLAAIESYLAWRRGPEPTVPFEVRYVPQQITISQACGKVWNCSDVLPSEYLRALEATGLTVRWGTFASAARAMHAAIRRQ
jgi:hypothetical protein